MLADCNPTSSSVEEVFYIWIININTEQEKIIDIDYELHENIVRWLYLIAENRYKSNYT